MTADDPSDRFIAQFDWDGMVQVYRAHRIGPAYRVTIDEYHDFVSAYDRNQNMLTGAWLAGLLLIFIAAFSGFLPDIFNGPLDLLALILALRLLKSVTSHWLLRAPDFALGTRTPDLPAVSKDDRLRHLVGEQSRTSLFIATVFFCIYMAGLLWMSPNLAKTWGYWFFWLLPAIGLDKTAMTMFRIRRQGIRQGTGSVAT